MANKQHQSKTRKQAGAAAAKHHAVGLTGSRPSATHPRAQP